MAKLTPSDHQLSIHLADRNLTPIISSSILHSPSNGPSLQSQSQLQALSSLTSTAVSAFDSAGQLGLGIPQRIMIETKSFGPVILHSYLNSQLQSSQSRHGRSNTIERSIIEQARDDLRPLSDTTESETIVERGENSDATVSGEADGVAGAAEGIDTENLLHQPPVLIASVIAPSAMELREARRAAAKLERTGREIQREWVRSREKAQGRTGIGEDV